MTHLGVKVFNVAGPTLFAVLWQHEYNLYNGKCSTVTITASNVTKHIRIAHTASHSLGGARRPTQTCHVPAPSCIGLEGSLKKPSGSEKISLLIRVNFGSIKPLGIGGKGGRGGCGGGGGGDGGGDGEGGGGGKGATLPHVAVGSWPGSEDAVARRHEVDVSVVVVGNAASAMVSVVWNVHAPQPLTI